MLEGKVVHGKKLGRKLGFPTANLEVNQDILLPKRVSAFLQDRSRW